MRLICPNCDAEYAVDDAAIPPHGRDVQCSACGHAWFQPHPEAEAAAEAEAALFDPPAAHPEPPPEAPAAAPLEVAAVAAAAPAAPRRTIDENLLAILREEAQRETAQRQRDAARGLESQPDLGLATATTRRAVAAPTAAPAAAPAAAPEPDHDGDGAPPTLAASAVSGSPARRTLLPDIEEINSTLRAGAHPRGGDAAAGAEALPVAPAHSSGFRTGFVAVTVAAGLMAATYAMAPRIAAMFPAAAPTMQRYVAGVDRARLWIDATLMQATRVLQGAGPAAGDKG